VDFESVVGVFVESGVEFEELSAGSLNSELEGILGVEFAVFSAESSDFELEGVLDAEFTVFSAESLDFRRGLYLSV